MSFDWQPESKDRYFRKAEAAVKAAGFDDILQISRENHFYSCLYGFRNGGAGQVRAGEIIERIRHMLKVKDCKHVCLFCEYYDMCKEEAKANEHEICKEK